MLNLTDKNFQKEVLEEKKLPVFIDFSAIWCEPCQMVAPTIEELATEYSGKLKIGQVDVDQAPKTSQKYGIMSVPTFIIFKNGEVVKQFVSARTKEGFKKEINSVLNN